MTTCDSHETRRRSCCSETKSPTRKASKLDQTAANLAMMTTAESSPTTEDNPPSAESSSP